MRGGVLRTRRTGERVEGSIPLPDAAPAPSPDADLAMGPVPVRAAADPADPPGGDSVFLVAVRELLAGLDHPPPVASRVGAIADGLDRAPGGGTVRARQALDALEALARRGAGGPAWSRRVLYEAERTRLEGAREAAETDLAEALRRRAVVPARARARGRGTPFGATTAPARLGLDADAGPGEVRRAAHEQLAVWRARAAHPASSRTVRDAAVVLAAVCEAVLAETGPD